MWLCWAGLCAAVLSLAGLFLYLDPQVPRAETYRNVQLETPLRIYAEDGALLAEFGERRLIPIALEDVPQQFIDALLDTEDKRFYEHSGIDFISLTNDAVGLIGTLITEGDLGPGASTITMQLARNVSFSLERRFIRKFKEMLLALKIERELSKDEILELYINVVPFGKRAYGAEAAALTYYGKPLAQLTLPQFAMLAGIPQAPSAGNPINGPERAVKRRNVVLSLMLAQESISREEYEAAIAAPISARVYARELDLASPYPAEWVRQSAIATLPDLYTAGYEIYTTIDSRMQAAAIEALRRGLLEYDRKHGYRGPETELDPELAGNLSASAPVLPPPTPEAGSEEQANTNEATDKVSDLDEDAPDVTDTLLGAYAPEDLDAAQSYVDELPIYGGLHGAVVLAATPERLLVIMAEGQAKLLDFVDSSWARPYIEVDRRGPAPAGFTDFLKVGDVVRAQLRDDKWQLAQLPEIQGAVVSMDPNNGRVKAMVGGFDFYQNQFNHALQAARQPGSGFKPFVYSAAIANGITPADIFMDAPLVFDDANLESQYRPDNDSNSYNGPTRLREALYRSINLVSMRVLLKVGAGEVLNHVADMGLATSSFPRNTQLAIGGGTMAITPIDMARAYTGFANGGYLIEPHIIDHIRDARGEVIFKPNHPVVCRDCEEEISFDPAPTDFTDNFIEPTSLTDLLTSQAEQSPSTDTTLTDAIGEDPREFVEFTDEILSPDDLGPLPDEENPLLQQPPVYADQILDERNVFIVNSMLKDVIRRGTGVRAKELGRSDLAGKTGTTNDAADTWFNGYSPTLATTVWVGFSNHEPLGATAFGSNTPLPIWVDYMKVALKDVEEQQLPQPQGVISKKIDPETGKLALPGQRDALFEFFLAEHAPQEITTQEPPPLEEEEVSPIDLF